LYGSAAVQQVGLAIDEVCDVARQGRVVFTHGPLKQGGERK
jgi:hypothetical protein